MESFRENFYTINTLKSPLHCLLENSEHPSKAPISPPKLHYHEYIELLFSIDSDAIVWINSESLSLKTGEMVIINSNCHHGISILKPSRYIVVKFLPDFLCLESNAFFEIKYILPFLEKDILMQKTLKRQPRHHIDLPRQY